MLALYILTLVTALGVLAGSLVYLYEIGFYNRAYLYVIRTRAEFSLIVTGFLAFRLPASL